MGLWWRHEDAVGAVVGGQEMTFDDQGDAEEWLGQQWQSLLERGVTAVTLLDGTDEVYGPMSLHPPG